MAVFLVAFFNLLFAASGASLSAKQQHLMRRKVSGDTSKIEDQNQKQISASLAEFGRSDAQSLAVHSQNLEQALQSYAATSTEPDTREFLGSLKLCVPCNNLERFGENNDGGYVMCTDGLEKGLRGAYSYGINGFDGWGMAVASRYNIALNEYDCTNAKKPAVCQGCAVTFHDECILNSNGKSQPKFKTLSQQFLESGNANSEDRSLLLKIDVESAEWKVFAEEPVENLKKFREIVVEYHDIAKVQNHRLYSMATKQLEKAGFAVAHLHANNFGGGLHNMLDYKVPDVLEVTYMEKPSGGCSANIPYHVPLDQANNADIPEIPDATWPA